MIKKEMIAEEVKKGVDQMTNRERVQHWLEEHFNMSEFSVQEMPIVPGGVVIKDSNGETMLVYWDILERKIVYEFA